VGKPKALVLADRAKLLNFKCNNRIVGLVRKLGPESESYFKSSFWSDADIVITALVPSSQ
jgi:hypothetical protein